MGEGEGLVGEQRRAEQSAARNQRCPFDFHWAFSSHHSASPACGQGGAATDCVLTRRIRTVLTSLLN